jgi:predicted lipoprotein with Yx(FWY)xxD motif
MTPTPPIETAVTGRESRRPIQPKAGNGAVPMRATRGLRRSSPALAAVSLIAVAVAACGGGTATPSTPKTHSGASATVDAARVGSLGTILVDSQGRTLYLFAKDSGSKSTCFGGCASAWPPVQVSGKPTAGAGVTASSLGTVARSDGQPQVTYSGHPLYRYVGDQKAGDANGQGINGFGALWYALSPAGHQITAQVASSGNG